MKWEILHRTRFDYASPVRDSFKLDTHGFVFADCTITGADGTTYVCQCHGSRYDRGGRVLQGPARASLRQFTTTFNEGVVTIAL